MIIQTENLIYEITKLISESKEEGEENGIL